jgi:hypothetical protein
VSGSTGLADAVVVGEAVGLALGEADALALGEAVGLAEAEALEAGLPAALSPTLRASIPLPLSSKPRSSLAEAEALLIALVEAEALEAGLADEKDGHLGRGCRAYCDGVRRDGPGGRERWQRRSQQACGYRRERHSQGPKRGGHHHRQGRLGPSLWWARCRSHQSPRAWTRRR